MSRSPDWMPQFNWPVFGPFLGILATLLVVGAVVGVRLWPGGDNVAGTPILSVDGTNPDRDAPLPENPGVGGPALQPPGARDARIRSLPARVSGTPGVRAGPGTQYPGLHQLKDGDEVHVIACSPGCEWLRLFSATDPQAQHWVPAVFLTVAGRVDSLPVLTPQ